LNALRDSVKGEPRGEAWLAQVRAVYYCYSHSTSGCCRDYHSIIILIITMIIILMNILSIN
jgi:hypothetical protein